MVVQRSVTHLLIHKLHLEACYTMSPALWNHLPEFPYQLSTKKLNLPCDFSGLLVNRTPPHWDCTDRSPLRVGWWNPLCSGSFPCFFIATLPLLRCVCAHISPSNTLRASGRPCQSFVFLFLLLRSSRTSSIRL